MIVVDIPQTFGALLIGGLFAAVLTGAVAVQVVVYFKLYPMDPPLVKALVLITWFLDITHTSLIWAALFQYLIFYFGNAEMIDYITWNLALTVAFTAVLTFLVHCFLAHRIWRLSRRNWYLTIPILTLAVLRLASASTTTAEMISLHSFTAFRAHFQWLFTLGLALSSTVDVIITASLLFLLHGSRTGTNRLNAVIDSLIRYTFETGLLTCAGTIVTMLCWLTISHNSLVFMGLHFVISKLYANSLLVTLNTRQIVRRAQSSSSRDGRIVHPIVHLNDPRLESTITDLYSPNIAFDKYNSQKLEISVVRSVEHNVEDGCERTINDA